ncbi:MAG: hypothetical protein E7571_03760 [Ruminococcaceae bacterium]|nr:hypothetical protein [Oscillospiraceae bacterium]
MKKLSFVLAAIMLLTLCSCSEKTGNKSGANGESASVTEQSKKNESGNTSDTTEYKADFDEVFEEDGQQSNNNNKSGNDGEDTTSDNQSDEGDFVLPEVPLG